MVRDDIIFRLIVDDPSDGRWNMAIDETLLEAVGAGESPPAIRFYGFEPPTLSVGRFQPTKGIVRFSRLQEEGLGFVRRPSGGQAVLHSDELTYAVVIGRDHMDPFGKRWVYRFIAPLLMAGLSRLGVAGAQRNHVQKGDPANPDCFGSTGEYEIDSSDGRKLVGSAQMVTRTAVLQHGSIPIGSRGRAITSYLQTESPSANHASNIENETSRSFRFAEVRDAFVSAIEEQLAVRNDQLQAAELRTASNLLETKYSTDQWNRKY